MRQAITADAPDDAVQDIQLPGAARFVLTETWEAVKATPQTVDPVVFEKIVADMCAASLTVWCGLPGDAALIAQSGDHKMTRAALLSRWVSDIDGLQAVGRMVKPVMYWYDLPLRSLALGGRGWRHFGSAAAG